MHTGGNLFGPWIGHERSFNLDELAVLAADSSSSSRVRLVRIRCGAGKKSF